MIPLHTIDRRLPRQVRAEGSLRCLATSQFVLVVSVVGVGALLRWQQPGVGRAMPGDDDIQALSAFLSCQAANSSGLRPKRMALPECRL